MAAKPSGQRGESVMMPVFGKQANAANTSCLGVCTVIRTRRRLGASPAVVTISTPFIRTVRQVWLSLGSFAIEIVCP